MATVTNTIKLPGNITPADVVVVIELVASTTASAAGWVTATDVTVLDVYRPTVTAGAWSADLTPNANITPSGTVYKVSEYVNRRRYIHYIEVDSDGGSVFDLLVDPPASLATAASELYADAAVATHAADTADAHDASAISAIASDALPDTDVQTALDRIATRMRSSVRVGSVGVYIGDSIGVGSDTVGGGIVDHNIRSISPFTFGSVLSKQRVRYYRNLSKGGDKTADVLTRWDSEIAPYSFSAAIICLGTNDSNNSVSLSTYRSNMLEIIDKCLAKGAGVILCTIPPNDNVSPADRKTLVATYNQWIRETSATYGFPLVDYYDLLADPADGDYSSTYLNDGTHPNNAGYYAMGQTLATTLGNLTPIGSQVPLPMNESDPLNLAPGGLFTATSGSGTTLRPSGWSIVTSVHSSGVTASFDSADSAINGSWYTLTVSGLTTTDTTFVTVSGITPAHRYRLVGRVKLTSPVNLTLLARMLFNGSTSTGYSFRALSAIGYEIPDGVFMIEGVAPSDASTVQLNFQLSGTSGSSGVVKLAQIGLYDLTSIGLA